MNQKKLLSYLKCLKEKFGLLAIKSEFEAEGSSLEEVCALTELCSVLDIPVTIKVGGPSAQRDFHECWQLGASLILVPMVESPQALQRSDDIFNQCCRIYQAGFNSPRLAFNLESIESYLSLSLLKQYLTAQKSNISAVVIGRSDLSRSMKLNDVNDGRILHICKSILSDLSDIDLEITVGGSITHKSYPFLNELSKSGDFTAFETRKCTLSWNQNSDRNIFNEAVNKSLLFELEWLKFKNTINDFRLEADRVRIEQLSRRVCL